jgi:hypothetical protein
MATKNVYRGFEIKPTHFAQPSLIKGKSVSDGFVTVAKGCNPMPGATWFQTIKEAKLAIDVLLMAGYQHDKIDSTGIQGSKFWAILDIVEGRYDRAILSAKELVLSDSEVESVVLEIKNKNGSITT